MKRNAIFIGILVCSLSGCSASQNPRTGGFFGGVQGLASGSYEQRIQEREQSLERLRSLQQEMLVEGAGLQDTKQSLDEIILTERETVHELERNTEQLLAELALLENKDAESFDQVEHLKKQLADLQTQMKQQIAALEAVDGENQNAELRLRQLMDQRDALRNEYDLLLNLTMELAR